MDTTVEKEAGVGPTTIEFVCACGNHWEAEAHWEHTRIVLNDPAADRCGNCGTEGVSL